MFTKENNISKVRSTMKGDSSKSKNIFYHLKSDFFVNFLTKCIMKILNIFFENKSACNTIRPSIRPISLYRRFFKCFFVILFRDNKLKSKCFKKFVLIFIEFMLIIFKKIVVQRNHSII